MIRTILILAWFWFFAAIMSPIALLGILFDFLGLYRIVRPVLGFFTRVWAISVIKLIGVKIDISGLEKLPDDEKIVFVANHEGDFDILLMLAYMHRPVAFIAKSQTIWFPFLNIWIYALGSSFINRKNIRQSVRAIENGEKSILKGHSMVIFPEGTRSRGDKINPFKRGSFKLATRTGSTIVPITINGSYKIWEEYHKVQSANVSMIIHDPIRTENLTPDQKRELPQQVEDIVRSALTK